MIDGLKICCLALLKLGYEVFIGLLFLTALATIISFIVGDKYYFIKILNKLRSYMYGEL